MNENTTQSEFQYYSIAENLFVREAFSISKLTALFREKVSAGTLNRWLDDFDWEEKRKKYVNFNRQLIADTRDLVSMTLTAAAETPSNANITSYKRAVEVLMALEKIDMLHCEAEDENENDLPAEKIDEFAKKAGLR